jgi:hypothetical protein
MYLEREGVKDKLADSRKEDANDILVFVGLVQFSPTLVCSRRQYRVRCSQPQLPHSLELPFKA